MSENANPDTADLSLPAPLLAAAEATVNRLLRLDPEGAARLAKVQGRVLRVELLGLGMHLYVVPEDAALRLFGDYAAEPDCTLSASPAALLAMALAEHREDEIFRGAVKIKGDNGLAQALGDLLKGLDIDWEEQLSSLLGDTLAHRIGQQARSGRHWAERTGTTIESDLREYLTEEGRLVPSETEMNRFLSGVDRLRDDVERLEARIERLAATTSRGD